MSISKSAWLNIALVIVFSVFSIQHASAARDRVKIQNNNVVADNGTRLRGAAFFLDHFSVSDMRNNENTYRNYFRTIARDYNMNLVRITPWIGDWETMQKSDQYYKNHKDDYTYMIDKAVQWAEEEGIYAGVNLHTRYQTVINLQKAKDFWDVFAPRYKNRTHVFYELINEPEPGSAKQHMSNLYRHVRGLAPKTHLVLWSPANVEKLSAGDVWNNSSGIDYSNASVGFHIYEWLIGKTALWDIAKSYRDNGLPTVLTEFFSLTSADYYPIDYKYVVENIRQSENYGFSWMQWAPTFNYRHTNQNVDGPNRFTNNYKNRVRNGYDGVAGIGFYWGRDNGGATNDNNTAQNNPPASNDNNANSSGVAGKKRFKDDWKGFYMHASANFAGAELQAANLRSDWGSQKWLFENVSGNVYRIKNAWTGRYLSSQDTNEWSSLALLNLNKAWGSQKWKVEASGNNTYRIKNQWSGLYINSPGSEWDVPRQAKLNKGWGSMRFYLETY